MDISVDIDPVAEYKCGGKLHRFHLWDYIAALEEYMNS